MKTEAQMAQEVYDHRHDPGEWAETPANVVVKPSTSEVVSVRLPVELVDRLEDAAAGLGESVSQFIRAAIQSRLDGAAVTAVDRPASGARRLTVRHVYGESWTEGIENLIPDFVPTTVQGRTSTSVT